MNDITGQYDKLRSFGIHTYYNLSNGYTAVVENSPVVGRFVAIIIDDRNHKWELNKYGRNWYHGDDIESLPDFAKDWTEEFMGDVFVRPNFEIVG